MNILFAFAPFLAFVLFDRLVGASTGLAAATVVSIGLLIRDAMTPGRSLKILEIGTAILFGGLTAYTFLLHPAWSIFGVRLCVDAGLLAIVLVSMAIGQPFTLQYAREGTDREIWARPEFIRVNYVITAVWALAFVVLVVADAVLIYVPTLPPRIGIIATILALVGAVKFTSWYPEKAAGTPAEKS
jgi:hypothetical protein